MRYLGGGKMETYLADLINNDNVPKWIRYLLVIAAVAFIVFVGVSVGLNSEFLVGKIFGFLFAITFFVIGIYLCVRIYKEKTNVKIL